MAPLSRFLGPDGTGAFLERLIEILAPGEFDVVSFIECYFDESGTHDGSPVMCVAGFVFSKDACTQLDRDWQELLKKYSLPYFRMVDCAHGNDVFKHLTRDECIQCEKDAIALIRKYMSFGSAVGVDESHYITLDHIKSAGSAYSWCCWMSLVAVRVWADRTNFSGKIAYFFEAGHAKQSEANALMNRIFKNERLKELYRYASHAFVDKKLVRPVQTADILAWLHATEFKRISRGVKELRADLAALIEDKPFRLFHFNQLPLLEDLMRTIEIWRPIDVTGSWGNIRFSIQMFPQYA